MNDIERIKGMLSKASNPHHHRQQEVRMEKEVERINRDIKRRTVEELQNQDNPTTVNLLAEIALQLTKIKEANQKVISKLDKAITKYEKKSRKSIKGDSKKVKKV